MIDLAWLRDVLLLVPAGVSAARLGLARSYQIRAARMFRTLPEAEKARLNTAGNADGDWRALSETARKVRDFRDRANMLTTFSGLLPTWCLVSLGAGLALQVWLVVAVALTGDAASTLPQ